MDDYNKNEFARILDSFGNELEKIILPNGEKLSLILRDGHYVIRARDAYVNNIVKLTDYSLKCTGISFNLKTRKNELCNADLTPYCLDGNYYFRSFQNANEDGSIHTPHNPYCPHGWDSRKKSIEWITSFKTEPDAMEKSFMECDALLQKGDKTGSTKASSSLKDIRLGKEKNEAKNKEQNETFEYETKEKNITPKSSKDFWFVVMNSPDYPSCLREMVMTPYNYKAFRGGKFSLSGIKTLMAKRCSDYKSIEAEIAKQLPNVAHLFDNSKLIQRIEKEYNARIEFYKKKRDWNNVGRYGHLKNVKIKKSKPIILEDSFCGEDPVIIVLVDRLPERQIWKRLSKRAIKQETVIDFLLGVYTEEKEQKEYPSDYFSVMSNWKEYTLEVDGKPRKLVVGDIMVLGRQIDYFKEQDLDGFEDDLL